MQIVVVLQLNKRLAMNDVFLSIGSNLGDRFKNIQKCIYEIKLNSFMKYISSSRIYETAPMYNLKQNHFLNLVLRIETDLEPEKLLIEIKQIESKMGRKFTSKRNQPRLVDIDILIFNNSIINNKDLVVPHPKITERIFVLKPWSDIDPNYKLPKINKTVCELISHLDMNSNIIKLYNKNL